jgi:autotransporter-associated beta strand protein
MKPTARIRPFLAALGCTVITTTLDASILYYDGGSVDIAGSGNSAATGLTGDWNTGLKNWDAGAAPYVGWDNTKNDIAFFHMGTAIPGPTPGTVALTSGITVGGLIFNASGYNINTGANALTFGAANNTVALNNSVTAATITGTIASSAANMTFTAQNPLANHALTFTGANTTGWSGTTTVNAGTTVAVEGSTGNRALGFTSAITLNGGAITTGTGVTSSQNTVDFFNDDATITVNGGGSFTWRPVNANTFNETIGAITVNSGQFNLLTASQSGPGLATLTTAGVNRTSSTSVLNYSLGNNGPLPSTGGTNFIQVSGSGTTTGWTNGDPSNSIIGAWATTGTTGAIDYAIYSGNMVRSANTVASAETTWTDAAKQYTLSIPSVTSLGASTALSDNRNVAALRASSATTSLSSATANASPTFTLTGHTLAVGDPVVLGGTAPTNFSTGRVYYVASIGTDTFTLSATPGGSAINAGNAATPNVTTGLKLDLNKNLGTTGILNGGTAPIGIGRTAAGGHVTLPTAGAGNLFVTNPAGAISIDAPIVNNGGALTLVKSGASNLFLTGNNTYTGGTVLNAGNVTLSGTNTFATGVAGADVINSGTLTYSTLAAWGGTGRDVIFNGTGTLTSTVTGYAGGTLTSNAGANAVVAGTNVLTFANTTGSGNIIFNVSATGTRRLELGNASGFTGNLQARLTNNANQASNVNIQFASIGDAAGSAIQFVGGTGDGNQAMTVAYNGSVPLVFNNRQIQILDRLTSNWEIRDNIIANNSGDAANTWTINTDLLYTGGRAITAFGGSLQTGRRFVLSGSNTGDNAFNGVISNGQNTNGLAVEKAGAGKWILGGANTYTGNTIVTAGNLEVQGTLGHVSSGVGNYAGNISIANTNSGRLVYNSAASQTLGGVISGNGALFVEDGSLTLSNDNTYTGATTVNGGSLIINGNSSTATGNVTVNSDATLGGNGTVGGATTIKGGAFLTPGTSAGVLKFASTLELESTAISTMEILGLNMVRGEDYDGVDVTGALTYGGALILDLGTLFEVGNYTFNLFDFGSLTEDASFASVTLDGLYSGSLVNDGGVWSLTDDDDNTWTFTQSTGDLNLVVIPEPRAALLGGIGLLMLLRRRR